MSADLRRPEAAAHRWLRWAALAIVVGSVGTLVVSRDFDALFAAGRSSAPPSMVFVLVDTLRADYVGAYGFEGDVSPHLDRVARESIVFDNAFSQAPWTKPSIASLFTSLYPEQHGVIAHLGRYGVAGGEGPGASALPSRATTLAEILRRAGYATAAFVANPWIQRSLGFAQGFDVFDARDVGNEVPASRLFGKALAWLARRDRSRPFFLYLHLMDVHGPYEAPRADYDLLRGSPGLGPPRPLTAGEVARRMPYLMRGGGPPGDPATREAWRAAYAAGVRVLDRQLGGFVDELSRDGVLDHAVLVIASDHGEELVDHGGWGHGGSVYDEQIRVPLMIRLPRGLGGGRRVERVVSLIDLMPTLLGMAGAPSPPGIAGHDLGAVLAGGDRDGPGAAYASGVKWRPDVMAVRTREGKLIRAGSGATVVFDLAADPGERRASPGVSAPRAAELAALLDAHRAALAAGPSLRRRTGAMAPGTRDKLRALGYLDDATSPGASGTDRNSPRPREGAESAGQEESK